MDHWIDTHCHLDAPEFDPDRSAVRAAARAAGVHCCVLPAVARSNWDTVRALAHAGGDAYALGIHPLFTPQAQDEDIDRLEQALLDARDDPRLVAVGEIGIDGFVPGLDRARQERFYRAQLRLARRFGLPVLLHVRRSADLLLKHLRAEPVAGGIAHAFNGSAQQARQFIDLGLRLGFGGAATFDRALQLRHLFGTVPDGSLVLETDAPDIPPHWVYTPAAERAAGRPQGRNSPAELPRIGAALAPLRGWDTPTLARCSSANALAALPRLAALGGVA
ncbi:MAG: TatD family hydrolase [Burkholderiaceae bacterium]